MSDIDRLTDVLEWSSEELIIPYLDPVSGRIRRYFPDFKLKVRQPDGKIKTIVVEIKPRKEIVGPKPQGRKTKRYITEVYTFAVNKSKWKAAEQYCASRGWEFMTMDEHDLGILHG